MILTDLSFGADETKRDIIGRVLDGTLAPLDFFLSPHERLDTIVITPTRYEDPSLEISSNVSVLQEEDIANMHAKYVPDILRVASGVVVSDYSGNGKMSRVDMRGFGDTASSNVLVLMDGRRTNQIDLSGADWTQIDINAIEKIEIVRGPQSVLYGDNAMGGVINIITKTGYGKEPEIGFKYERGSYDYSSYRVHTEGGTDFMDYYAMASTSYNNGYRINNHLETIDYNAEATFKPTDYFHLRSSAGYHRDWYGLPGAVKPIDINAIGRRGSISPDNRAKTEDYFAMLTPELIYQLPFGEVLFETDILLRGRRTNAIFLSSFGDVSNVHHIKTFGVTPKLAFTVDFAGLSNRIIGGLDYYVNKDEINSGLLSAMDTIIINKDTLGLYLTDTVTLPSSLIFNGGFRGEWAYYKFDQQAVLQGMNTKSPFEYAYEAGLTYKYTDKSSVYAKYSRSFRFPATDEWYTSLYIDYFSGLVAGGLNLELEPQTGNSYEIGIKENTSKYISLKADYYIMDLNNEIYYDPLTFQNSSYDHTIHHGLELETDLYVFDSLHVYGNYTFAKSFFVGGTFAGNEIPLVPRHKFSSGFDYTFMNSLTFRYDATYVGERRFINDLQNNMPKLKSYMVHNVGLSYRKYGLEIFGAINNIFDAEYSEYGVLDFTLTRPGIYPAPRRNFLIGVSYRF